MVKEVRKSSKYQSIIPDLIARIVYEETKKRKTSKEIIKVTKRKLHQIGGAYIRREIPYNFYRELFQKEQNLYNTDNFLSLCRQLMEFQSSTRERISILNTFYRTILHDIRPVRSIADIACGLNPLAIPWMSLDAGTVYYAYDIYSDMISFLNEFMEMTPVEGEAVQCDITQSIPGKPVDIVFMLKCLPCLEQIKKDIFPDYFKKLRCRYLVISFPVRSLGGKNRNMMENYENKLMSYLKDTNIGVDRFEFLNELAFRINF
ncbi:MAG: hypothetical protein PVI26_12530 [Chitinispirillia bacterium]